MVKVSLDGMKVISLPDRPSLVPGTLFCLYEPVTFSGASELPWVKLISWTLPSRRIFSLSQDDSALTTETPTPCRPPETL